MKKFFENFLCCCGLHDKRIRTNAGAKETICMRHGCDYREILQARRDNPQIKISQNHKSPRMKHILK